MERRGYITTLLTVTGHVRLPELRVEVAVVFVLDPFRDHFPDLFTSSAQGKRKYEAFIIGYGNVHVIGIHRIVLFGTLRGAAKQPLN